MSNPRLGRVNDELRKTEKSNGTRKKGRDEAMGGQETLILGKRGRERKDAAGGRVCVEIVLRRKKGKNKYQVGKRYECKSEELKDGNDRCLGWEVAAGSPWL